jgi:hypothetical protein
LPDVPGSLKLQIGTYAIKCGSSLVYEQFSFVMMVFSFGNASVMRVHARTLARELEMRKNSLSCHFLFIAASGTLVGERRASFLPNQHTVL